jgi:hypothetical protein
MNDHGIRMSVMLGNNHEKSLYRGINILCKVNKNFSNRIFRIFLLCKFFHRKHPQFNDFENGNSLESEQYN